MGHNKRAHFRNLKRTEYFKNLPWRVWIYRRYKGGCGPTTVAGSTACCDDVTYLSTYPSYQGGSSHRKAFKNQFQTLEARIFSSSKLNFFIFSLIIWHLFKWSGVLE